MFMGIWLTISEHDGRNGRAPATSKNIPLNPPYPRREFLSCPVATTPNEDDIAAPIAYAHGRMTAGSTAEALAATAILIVGAPRSGTTWLGKIFDSHPDVIYRHEPDGAVPETGSTRADVAIWVAQRDPRTAGKRPFFPKSWQSSPARLLRASLAYSGAAASRIGLPDWPIPDLGSIAPGRAVIKSVRLSAGIGDFANAFPDGRAVLILRDPRGQVASVMRGASNGRFNLAEAGTDMPFDEASTLDFAARRGVDEPAFQRLPNAAKYAWSWRAFNETAFAAIAGRSNATVVIYEALCADPASQARAVMAFAGLPWHRQTDAFLDLSTRADGSTGYYAVVRNSIAAANWWRTTMSAQDQEAVGAVVRELPLAHYWPDLAGQASPE